MVQRKSPVKHHVRQHIRKNRSVRSYIRGKGELKPIVLKRRITTRWDKGQKILDTYNKAAKDKLINKRYLVDIQTAYFWNYYVGVKDYETGKQVFAWLPSILNEKKPNPERSAEALYLWLDNPKRCEEFLAGRVTKIRKEALGKSFGQNLKFDSY